MFAALPFANRRQLRRTKRLIAGDLTGEAGSPASPVWIS
jgi:hypothetical protein